MIFVTVGTHEQQFNRLVREIDRLKETGVIDDEVMIQTGFSDYEPKFCKWSKLIPYEDMQKYMDEAKIIITHGGPSSFLDALKRGKFPIVVPRKKEFDEHVNDHQVDFCNAVAEKKKNILVVNDIAFLRDTILNYDKLVSQLNADIESNNASFNRNLEIIINHIFEA